MASWLFVVLDPTTLIAAYGVGLPAVTVMVLLVDDEPAALVTVRVAV